MNKNKAIVALTIISVFVILMAVFAVVSFEIAGTMYDYTGYAKTIKLGLDMSGGVSATFNVTEADSEDLDQRIQGTVDSMLRMLVNQGYTEATVTQSTTSSGTKQIIVEVPDVDDPERVLDLIGRPATLEIMGENDPDAKAYIVGRDHLNRAFVTTQGSDFAVGLEFNEAGTKAFAEFTEEYNGKTSYIFINGELYTQVQINAVITDGRAVITNNQGGYTYQEAYDFATQLQSGTFGVQLETAEVRNISPTLGEDALKNALIAGAVGIGLIFIFMAVVYRGMGIAADIALCVYVVLLLWFCSVLPWVQLTLPGLAGILLSIGMAVDANIVIFERIKDEYKTTMKPIPSSIKAGFKRSAGAIIDGNVTTLIGAIVLWVIGSASIVGFAVTLFIGIILSMFTALVVTRIILKSIVTFNSTGEKFYGLKRGRREDKDDIVEGGKVA